MKNNVRDRTMNSLYVETCEWTKYLRDKGYNVIEMWSHEFQAHKDMKNHQLEFPVITKLNPRDAFYGGRTETISLYRKPKDNEVIRYIDVCSLYPAVQLFDYYPEGHPDIILNPKCYDVSWYGFVKCKVLPPRQLFHPLLPCKMNGKLVFPLCYTCARDGIKTCNHDDNDRSLIGTWTTIEVNKAITLGYKVSEVYEVHHFPSRTDQLFKDYIQKFMKIKLECSTDKDSFKTPEEKAKFIDEAKIMGIDLDESKFQKNVGKRQVSKIFLNSLWGKFGQQDCLKQVKIVTEVSEYYKILHNRALKITNIIFLNQNAVRIEYKQKAEFAGDPTSTNVYIAAYTTANARLRLYEALEKLGDRVLYMDSDSVVYADNGKVEIKTGNLVGDWEDEFKGFKGYDRSKHGIVEWVSTGPKSYAAMTNIDTGNGMYSICKCKGFRSSFVNAKSVNMANMERILVNDIDKITVKEEVFVRDSYGTISTRSQIKGYKFLGNFNKRVVNENQLNMLAMAYSEVDRVDTYPFGY
jgi:hypothetical protein